VTTNVKKIKGISPLLQHKHMIPHCENKGLRNDVTLTDASDSAVINSAINTDDEAV
jgi:hypothetical protein